MSRRHCAAAAISMLCLALLTSCWDRTELSELAIVSMVGLDRDPESGIYTIHLQIINPASGASAHGTPGGEQSPVYTYEARGKTLADAQVALYNLMPRRLFLHHAKAVLISGRTAKSGIRDIMNFSELQPDARTSIPLLVVDGSLAEVMRTFTPLERNPAESLTSRIELLADYALKGGRRIEIRDVIERAEKDAWVVLPLVRATGKTGDYNSWEANAEIDATLDQLRLDGGAVVRNYRMVGRLNENELVLYHLLTGEKGRFVRRIPFRNGHVSASLESRRADQRLIWENGKPVVRIRLRLRLSTLTMKEFHPQTLDDIRSLEKAVDQAIADEAAAFVSRTRERGWDLLDIRNLLHRKAPHMPDLSKAADDAEVRIEVETRLTGMGNLSRLFEGTGGER